MDLPKNIAKSSLLAGAIFWIVGGSEEFNTVSIIPIIFISYLPIFICCAVTILVTVCPFYWLAEKESLSKRDVFNRYYPYYSIVCFGFCSYGIYVHIKEAYFIGFFISVFITTMHSWIWFAKEKAR